MKIILAFLLYLCIATPVFAQERIAPNVPMRGLIWGIPMDAVREFEKTTYVGEEDDSLIYTDIVQPDSEKREYRVYIEYHFTKDALDRIRYDIDVDHATPQSALEDVLTWQLWLDYQFGQTSQPDFQFRSTAVRDDPARWGWTIYKGDGSVKIRWKKADTGAELSLTGKDYTPHFDLTLSPAKTPAHP
jgi:hypothetical protein